MSESALSMKGQSFEVAGQHFVVVGGTETGIVKVYHEETGRLEERPIFEVLESLQSKRR